MCKNTTVHMGADISIHQIFMLLYNRTSHYLGDTNTVDPLLEGSDIITAEVLDVLRLLLDLRVLYKTQTHMAVLYKMLFVLLPVLLLQLLPLLLLQTL